MSSDPCLCGDPACGRCFPSYGYQVRVEAKCNGCGREYTDASELSHASLDAYAGKDDYDLFCPACESDDITLFEVP